MMYLLDTNAMIWWVTDDERLGREAYEVIQRGETVFVSDIAYLELAIKLQTGKMRLNVSIQEIAAANTADSFKELRFDAWAAQKFVGLPELHWSDPFDRAHMALADAKNLTIITSDQNILKSNAVRCLDARQ